MAVDVGDLRIRISTAGSQQAAADLARIGQQAAATGRDAKHLAGGFGTLSAALRALQPLLAAFGAYQLGSSFLEANRAAGTLRASLQTVMGSLEGATLAWEALQDFAAETPYTLEETVKAFTKLKSMGLDPSIAALTSYGNTAGAMGKSLNDMIEAVADASMGEFERLKEFGIRASKEGDQVALTFRGVTKTVDNSAAAIEQALMDLGNTEFAGGMDLQAQKLDGVISTLGDAWGDLWVKLGDAGLTQAAITVIRDLSAGLESLGNSFTATGDQANVLTATLATLGGVIATTYNELKSGDWGATTTAIVAATGAIGGAVAMYVALNTAIGVVTAAQGLLMAALMLNPYTAVIAAVAALAGALYALRDETINIGETTATVGSVIEALWQTVAANVQAAWETFLGWIGPAFEGIGTTFQKVATFVVEAWSKAMDAITGITSTAVNIIGSLFNTVGTVIGAVAGEIVVAAQTGEASWQRLTDFIRSSDAGEYLDVTGKAAQGARTALDELGQGFQANVATMEAVNQVNRDYAELERELATDQAKAAQQAKLAALNTQLLAEQKRGLNTANQAATGGAKKLAAAQGEVNKELETASRTVEGLINKYLPLIGAERQLEEAQQALAATGGKVSTAFGEIALTAEQQQIILQGMEQDFADLQASQARAADTARREADGFYNAWMEGVEGLDDAFQGLWRSLITGQGEVLGNLKETVLEWVADLSYQLLLSPLIVPIQGALMGIMGGGAAGVTGTATSVLGGASSLSSMFSGFSSLASGITNVFSGAALTGIMDGFGAASSIISAQGYFGGFGANMAMASGAAGTGSTSFAIGAALPYAIPAAIAVAAAVAIFSKWQSDQEPRYGTLAAMTGGSAAGLEDSEWGAASGAYVKGSFGLNFGLTDKGSKNMEAAELTEIYQGLADVSDALADFFGEELSAFIEAELQTMSDFGDGLIHLTENEGDLGGAMAALVERIAQAAGRSADDIGIAFGAMVGDLSGTAEEVGAQIQAAMVATAMAVELSDQYDNTLGKMLELTGDIGTDVDLLKGYIDQFGQSGEATGDTLTRLVMQLGLLETAAGQTATQLEGLSAEAVITLSDDLIKAFGGPEAASQAMSFFYEEFTTQTEKLVDAITAAAERINQDVPKLQEELMKLSEDVTTTVVTATAALAEAEAEIGASLNAITGRAMVVTSPAEGLDAIAAAIDEGMSGISTLGDAAAENLRRQAEGWVRSIEGWEDLYGVSPAFLISVTDGLELYGSALKDMGYVVDQGAQAFLESLRQAEEVAAGTEGELPAETITTPGDPNAAILAELLNDLPKTREGFEALIGAIDLTTEAGRLLYAGLMQLAPQFDMLYDGVETFTDWLLGVDQVAAATRELERVFADWGMSLPETRDALLELYESGALSTEQMAILGAYLAELGLVFGDVSASAEGLANDLSSELDAAMAALREAVEAERDAITEAHEARMEGLNAEMEAAQEALSAANEALSEAQSVLSAIQSALSSVSGQAEDDVQAMYAALAQLSEWVAAGIMPDQQELSQVLNTLSGVSPDDFATYSQYQAMQAAVYANLMAMEQMAKGQVNTAELALEAAQDTVDKLQAQIDLEDEWYKSEMERLDDILETAEDQVDYAKSIYDEVLTIEQALANLAAILEQQAAADQAAQEEPLPASDPASYSVSGMAMASGPTDYSLAAASVPTYSQPTSSEEEDVKDVLQFEFKILRQDLAAYGVNSLRLVTNIDDRLKKWDYDGFPFANGELSGACTVLGAG